MDTIITVGIVASAVVTGAVVALRVIAPLTSWKGDDFALTWAERLERLLATIFVPGKYLAKDNVKFPSSSSLGGGKSVPPGAA